MTLATKLKPQIRAKLCSFTGAASVARAWSSNFDSIFGNAISGWMSYIPWPSISGIAAYPDVLAFLIVLVLTGWYCTPKLNLKFRYFKI